MLERSKYEYKFWNAVTSHERYVSSPLIWPLALPWGLPLPLTLPIMIMNVTDFGHSHGHRHGNGHGNGNGNANGNVNVTSRYCNASMTVSLFSLYVDSPYSTDLLHSCNLFRCWKLKNN